MRTLVTLFAVAFILNGPIFRVLAANEPVATSISMFDEAREKAATENKGVLLIFSGAWDSDCARLEQSTLSDGKVSTLLRERTIPVRINVLTAPELTGKYHVRDVPLMVLIKPDGTEIDRWLGYHSAGKFAEELTNSLAGHPTLELLRAAVIPAEPKTRRELCETLINRGSYADAMTELRRLYEQLEFSNDPDLKRQKQVIYTRVIRILGSIREAHPPANDFLTTKRKIHAAEVSADPTDTAHARRVAALDWSLGQPDETLAFFHSLPKESLAYETLKKSAFDILVNKRDYSEAITLFSAPHHTREIEKDAAMMGMPIMHVLLAAIHTMYPLQGGELIKLLHKNFTQRWTKAFEPFAGTHDSDGARAIAEIILKSDKSEDGAAILTASARRALGDQADAFLLSLNLPGLPAPAKSVVGQTDEDPNWKSSPYEEDSDVIRLEPYMVTARTTGCIPLSLGLPAKSLKIEIKSHIPVHTPPTITLAALESFRNGALLVAINGKSIKGKTWKWLGDFWLEGGEAGDQVTLVLKGKGLDDCIYHEVTVKRVRPAKMVKE
jgi:thioredoxin-related protein